jgi:hypothetical protein
MVLDPGAIINHPDLAGGRVACQSRHRRALAWRDLVVVEECRA